MPRRIVKETPTDVLPLGKVYESSLLKAYSGMLSASIIADK